MKTTKTLAILFILLLGCTISNAQFADFVNYPVTVTPHESPDSARGHFWGYMFGSYFTKTHADSLQRGNTQYSQLAKGTNEFSIDRVYLGYDYFFNHQFSVHAVLAYEQTSDDAFSSVTSLSNYQRTTYLKYANMEWANMFNTGLKLSIGAITTPSFAITEEPFWGYRSVDRTIMDMKGITGSNDVGANIGGKVWKQKDEAGTENACVGFNFMVGNSTGSIADEPGITGDYTTWKKYYGDIYFKAFHDKLILDLYADGHTFSWTSLPVGHDLHQYEVTERAFLGYKIPNFNISAEYFRQLNYNMVDRVSGTDVYPGGDITDDIQAGVSIMSAVVIMRDPKTGAPQLSAFARYDFFNPFTEFNPNDTYQSGGILVAAEGKQVNLVNSIIEDYSVVGIDYQPIKQIHLMPNIWFDGIHDRGYNNVPDASPIQHYDYDLVYRITFYYQFFKNEDGKHFR
jgi:hypothetical protein